MYRVGVLAALRSNIAGKVNAFLNGFLLSAERFLKQATGVVITASHNPEDDNGSKIIDSDGVMIPSLHQTTRQTSSGRCTGTLTQRAWRTATFVRFEGFIKLHSHIPETPSQGMLEASWETLATSLANASSPEEIAVVLRSIWPVRLIPAPMQLTSAFTARARPLSLHNPSPIAAERGLGAGGARVQAGLPDAAGAVSLPRNHGAPTPNRPAKPTPAARNRTSSGL